MQAGSLARLTRTGRQARTRQHLLEAAALVFARRGFHGAGLDEVAKEVVAAAIGLYHGLTLQ